MKKIVTFKEIVDFFQEAIENFPDKRTGKNVTYSLKDAVLGAFSVFFIQSPSFLDYQKSMEETQGTSNAHTIFGIKEIPTDNHIRDLLDPANPELIFPVFDKVFDVLLESGHLEGYRMYNGDLLIALDGTWYHDSKKIYCDNCSRQHHKARFKITKETLETLKDKIDIKKLKPLANKEFLLEKLTELNFNKEEIELVLNHANHKDETTTYYHSMITPVIVAPGKNKVIPLAPEFILPQDGCDKQDCENKAAKRWLTGNGKKYSDLGITISGDDLYSNEPVCKEILNNDFNFILVCKPTSHKTLYEWIKVLEEGNDLNLLTLTRWNGRFSEIYTYKYANNVPIKDGEEVLSVNWFEVTVSKKDGKRIYKNSFITNHKITDGNIEDLVLYGRARWKVENENNNILKTKGYNLEHNYGHGKKNLSSLFASFILLAFLFHTLLDFMDDKYRLLRKKLPSRKKFFNDIRALTTYICFNNWEHLMSFMLKGLKKKFKPG